MYWYKLSELGRRLENFMMRWDDREKRKYLHAWMDTIWEDQQAVIQHVQEDARLILANCMQVLISTEVWLETCRPRL
jgi:hypothetical protein